MQAATRFPGAYRPRLAEQLASFLVMCRSIKLLRDGATPAPSEEVEAAALQFVRKISGFRQPASHNKEAFDEAVAEIAHISEHLLSSLEIRGAKSA